MTTQILRTSATYKSTQRPARRILTLLAILLALTGAAVAQVGSAALSGIVQDPTGAAVPDATVILTNAQTAQQRTLHSNGAGSFTFSSVPNGDYKLAVSHTGFRSYTRHQP